MDESCRNISSEKSQIRLRYRVSGSEEQQGERQDQQERKSFLDPDGSGAFHFRIETWSFRAMGESGFIGLAVDRNGP